MLGEPLPILVDVSRSGREYPNDMRSPVSFSAIHDNVSMWLDDLYDSAPRHGATMLYCTIAHMYVDTAARQLRAAPARFDFGADATYAAACASAYCASGRRYSRGQSFAGRCSGA